MHIKEGSIHIMCDRADWYPMKKHCEPWLASVDNVFSVKQS